ncbi:neutral zinc metallopeptidase [Sphaerisporangium fuscum]|uniref:neutral zinc metallopeptidase n=1 Tax=Sphaerisporangium fuscum TaxID=2835868 RepID=UPI001BDD8813|nr:neutral zinc metallopeptidase [Sphaerisporangium fuscum]
MRKPTFALLFALVGSLFLGGTAQAAPAAYPVENATVLTHNALYASGRLAGTNCPEPAVRAGDVASVRNYLTPLLKCLDTAWSAQFAKAGIGFVKPRVKFITTPQRVCGEKWGKDVQALYCDETRQITVMLDKSVVDHPEDLFLMDVIAHEYGHHVQNMAGMSHALDRLPNRGKAEYLEQTRRHELQAECLAGVFIGSIWTSLDRTGQDWKTLLRDDLESGDETTDVRDHGKGRNIAEWLDRGFKAVSPSGCNTWSAGSATVA